MAKYPFFSEYNRANVVGIRPWYEGEIVQGNDSAENATTVVYTVPSDKVLLLTLWSMLIDNNSGSSVTGEYWIYDDAPAQFMPLRVLWYGTGRKWGAPQITPWPVEMSEDYSLRVISPIAGCVVTGYFRGILCDRTVFDYGGG